MTGSTDYTIAAETEGGTVVIAEVAHVDLTESGAIAHVDPNSIEVETNIRTVVKLDPAFVASIKQHGVLQPVLCRRDENGTLTVRAGQRRVLAAREAGRPTVPAYIVEGDEATVTRVIEQFAENEHRAGLTEPERAAVFQQLAFEGLTIPQIAKRTGVKRATVEAGIKVAESATATTVVGKHAVTLDQAAAMIEFEDDRDALARLVTIAEDSPEHFEHELQRQRDQRERRERVNAERASLVELGYTVVDNPPQEDGTERLSRLATKDGEDLTVDHLTGVGADRVAYVTVDWLGEIRTSIYVRNFKTYGFKKRPEYGHAAAPMTDEQKAERRTLIANNKAWDSAEVVRRQWLATFLSRKTLPKDAAAFVTLGLTQHRHNLAAALSHGNVMAAQLLGLDKPNAYGTNSVDLYAEQPGKAAHAALAIILGAMEDATGRHTWRNPTGRDLRYFAQLAAWGYTLSEVEQIVIDAKTSATDEHQDTEPENFEPDDFEPDDLDAA